MGLMVYLHGIAIIIYRILLVNQHALTSVPSTTYETTTPTSLPDPLIVLNGSGPQRAGENYTLTCTASGGEGCTPAYQWHRDGTLLTTQSPSGRLSFSPLGQADSGEYTCTVTRGTVTESIVDMTITVRGEHIISLSVKTKIQTSLNFVL